MADDKTKVGNPDRKRVAGGEGYEVRDFAQKHGISPDEARKLIDEVGNNHEKLDAAVAARKRGAS